MRPGWLNLLFVLTVIQSSSAWANTRPDYLIVPAEQAQQQSIQSAASGATSKIQSVPDPEWMMRAGSTPEFQLEFADVRDNTGQGFDHPQFGAGRKQVALAVFERISEILDGEPGSAKIRLDSRSPWLNENTLAVGIPYFQCVDGFQKPIIFNALREDTHVHSVEGELLVNFDLPLNNSLAPPPVGTYDLFTILFHEITHVLGFVGFTVEADGRPRDCGGARMMPAIAEFTTDATGQPLWTMRDGAIEFQGDAAQIPDYGVEMFLNVPGSSTDALHLPTFERQVSGHWLPEDFADRNGVLMLREPFPTGKVRRNMTPETKNILSNILQYEVGQEARGLTGSWVDAELDGQGFSLHFMNENRFVIYFFGFRDNGERLWMLGLHNGSFQLGSPITIPLIEASGGQFLHPDAATVSEFPWGEMELVFRDCKSAQATLTGADGVQEMELFQLAGVDTLDCF